MTASRSSCQSSMPEESGGLSFDPALASVPCPAGLACRDTLRLEAGMPYGHELTGDLTPFDAGRTRLSVGLAGASRSPRAGQAVADRVTGAQVGTGPDERQPGGAGLREP